MSTLDDVYRKFGEASEAAQLLETELGNLLFLRGAIDARLLEREDPSSAADLMKFVNRQTLGQLLNSLQGGDDLAHLQGVLTHALAQRNRLSHSFYRKHNSRRNSEEGCTEMMSDLESIHAAILDAYKAVLLLSGVDLEKVAVAGLPTKHLPI